MDRTSEQAALAKQLAKARRRAGLTQKQVAAVLSVSRPTISWMETGSRAVQAIELKHLARLYGVSVLSLLGEAA